MQDEFLRLQGALKKTILFTTHDFDEALRIADRIAIMKDGIIEQLDTPAKIVKDWLDFFCSRSTRYSCSRLSQITE